MTESTMELHKNIDHLLNTDIDDLYKELGAATKAIDEVHIPGSSFSDLRVAILVLRPEKDKTMLSDIVEFGKNVFKRMESNAYELICGSNKKPKDLDKALKEFGYGEAAAVAALTTLFVNSFGWTVYIASLVAAIIIKLFFRPVYGEFCEAWSKSLTHA